MNEMLEKAVSALTDEEDSDHCRRVVIAVLKAIREPSEEMEGAAIEAMKRASDGTRSRLPGRSASVLASHDRQPPRRTRMTDYCGHLRVIPDRRAIMSTPELRLESRIDDLITATRDNERDLIIKWLATQNLSDLECIYDWPLRRKWLWANLHPVRWAKGVAFADAINAISRGDHRE